MASRAKHAKAERPKPDPQLRVKVSPEKYDEYEETARRWGYEQLAPFVRRLMHAASMGNPDSGLIQFFKGSDEAGISSGGNGHGSARTAAA